jgi:hypothetical protein
MLVATKDAKKRAVLFMQLALPPMEFSANYKGGM